MRKAVLTKVTAALYTLASPLTSGTFTDSGQALGQNANDVALGDLDLDGDLDAFLAHPLTDTVWLNQGGAQGGTPGVFADSGQSLGSQYSLAVALGDLDADGDLDAFVIEDDSTGNAIWINQGGAQGGAPGVFSGNGQTIGSDLSSNVALGDVDGDGDQDAFVTRSVGRADKVWLNNGTGQFSDSGQSLGNRSGSDVALGDLDGDGDRDAFVADDSLDTVWFNQGGSQGGTLGTFVASGQTLTNTLSIGITLGDVDRDGDLDAFTASVNGSNRLWINQGGDQGGTPGAFGSSAQSLGPNNNRHVTLVDVDVDGDLDLFVARNGPNSLWRNQGGVQGGAAGQFQDSGQSMGNLFSLAVALGDIDGDNDPDAMVANLGPTQVWLNQGLSGLETLYRVRDEVMAATPRGQHYINLFYTHNPETLGLLLSNPALFDQAYGGLVAWLPNLESLVDGSGGQAVITSAQAQAVDQVLTNLSAVASPALQQVIAAERAALPPPTDFVGMTISEARLVVIGSPMVYLPLVMKGPSGNAAASTAPSVNHGLPVLTAPLIPRGGKCVLYCLLTGDCN